MKKVLLLTFCSFYIVARAQNVGIGTNTPVSKLTIQTPLNSTGLTHIGGSNEIIVDESIGGVSASFGTTTNHAFRIKANNSGLLHIYPGGEVTVGSNTTPSFGRFTVETLNNSYGISHLGENGNILATRMGGTSAGIGTFSNTNMRLFCNSQNALIIDAANGNIGIGTDAPTAKLDVGGNLNIGGTSFFNNSAQFATRIGVGTSPVVGIGINILHDNEAMRLSGSQPFISFYNGANYKGYMWNKGADDMELGTASGNTNGRIFLSIKGTPYLTLHSSGQISINGPAATFFETDGNKALTVTNSIILKDKANNFNEWSLTSKFEDLVFTFNGLAKSWIDINGDYNTFSDMRLKENFQPYKSVLPDIQKLNVLTYHYKSNEAGKNSFGLIAQNVAEYFPEIVSPYIDKNGNKLFAIAYGKTGVLAIKAIQEQQEIIEQQQQKIENLEKRLTLIEKLLAEKLP